MKMVMSLVMACVLGMLLLTFGLFAAKEQGPPGLNTFSSDIAVVATLGLVLSTTLLVFAVAKWTRSPYERMRRATSGLLVHCKNLYALSLSFGTAAVRLVFQPHFQTTRLRSFTA